MRLPPLLPVALLALLLAACGKRTPDTAAEIEPTPQQPGPWICINGIVPEAALTVRPGQLLHIRAKGESPNQELTLKESRGGALWYRGPADALDLQLHALRTRELHLEASFAATGGTPAHQQAVVLALDRTQPALYPGWVVRLLRVLHDDAAPLPSFDSPMGTTARWPAEFTPTDYPAFRTAESIHPAPRHDPKLAWWSPPDYFHALLPNTSILPDSPPAAADKSAAAAALQAHRQLRLDWRAYHAYPFRDIDKRHRVALRMEGEVLAAAPGTYEFRFESNLPSRLRVGTAEAAGNATAAISFRGRGTLPVTIVLANSKSAPTLTSRLLWKPPGAADFAPLPPAMMVHPVDAVAEAALAKTCNDFAHRSPVLVRTADDTPAQALLATPNLASKAADITFFAEATKALATAYLQGKSLAGDPAVAHALFALVDARSDHLRTHPVELSPPGFGKTDGRMIRSFDAMLPVLALAESHPALQARALAARAELAQYAVATCLSRSFFAESHQGPNDGYDDQNNLILNFPRVARCLDDPIARDTVASLTDSFYRFSPGTGEGMGSDGMYVFHNANGRHIHPLGYGTSWWNRIQANWLYGTPWSRTAEQNHRLTDFLLAFEWLYFHNTHSWVADGRHMSHKGNPAWLSTAASQLLKSPGAFLAKDDRSRLQEMMRRVQARPQNSIAGNHFFFRNLYMVHRRADYFIDVKMTSPLAGPCETFAGMLPWNMGFADGVTTFMRDGSEFRNIHQNNGPNAAYGIATGYYMAPDASNQVKQNGNPNLWLYRALPGTVKLDDELHQRDRYRQGVGSAAGGCSDGTLGHTAYDATLPAHGAGSRKFHAFTDDGMLALVSGITTLRKGKLPADVTVRTNLNQCDWLGDIRILTTNGQETILRHNTDNHDLRLPLDQRIWIEHHGIGYLLLPTGAEGGPGKPGTLRIQAATRTAFSPVPGWTPKPEQLALLRQATNPDRAAKVFHLWIDHGQQVSGAKSAYFVCMRAAATDARAWLATPPLVIHANDPAVQAATDTRDGTTHVFLHQAGSVADASGRLLVSSPDAASVMWRPATMSVTVQDPHAACTTDRAKLIDSMQVTLGPGLQGIPTQSSLTIDLPGTNDPDDRHRGQPVTRTLPR